MNMTLDNTVKSYAKSCTRETLGRILLKGDGISLIEEENDTVLGKYKKKEGDKENEKTVKWKTIGVRIFWMRILWILNLKMQKMIQIQPIEKERDK